MNVSNAQIKHLFVKATLVLGLFFVLAFATEAATATKCGTGQIPFKTWCMKRHKYVKIKEPKLCNALTTPLVAVTSSSAINCLNQMFDAMKAKKFSGVTQLTAADGATCLLISASTSAPMTFSYNKGNVNFVTLLCKVQ